jgi:hypothetical protein
MTQFANLVLKNYDNEDKTFTVGNVDVRTGVSTWYSANPVTTVLDARHQATFSLTLPSAKSDKARIKLKVSTPVLDLDGKRIDENLFTCEFAVSKRCFLADRQDLLGFARSFLATANVTNGVLGSEGTF